jgi:lactoylglutathione lyase
MITKKFLHVRYRVDDLEKTVNFYTEVLGLEVKDRKTSGRGSKLVFFDLPGGDAQLELCEFSESGPVKVGYDLTHLAFEVEDMGAFAKHAESKGYPLSDGPHEGEHSIIAFVDAPEGYEIELIQRK